MTWNKSPCVLTSSDWTPATEVGQDIEIDLCEDAYSWTCRTYWKLQELAPRYGEKFIPNAAWAARYGDVASILSTVYLST